jgi:hypothetical protein
MAKQSPPTEGPSREVVALAKELIRNPDITPVVDNPALQTALRRVRVCFDKADRGLIARTTHQPANDPKRVALELAIARRIHSEEIEARTEAFDSPGAA